MADRLYCVDGGRFAIYDFETREVRHQSEHPHPDGNKMNPPFYVDQETFWGIVGRIARLDELNRGHAEKKSWEISPP